MPKVPIDYTKTQIYKYVCNDSSVLCEYVGHTTNWDKRKASHKEKCNDEKGKKYHLKIYEIMRANGGFNNWKMILIEDYPCKSKREAEQREQYHIDLLVEKMNTINAFTENQYQKLIEENPDYNKEKYQRTLELNPNHNQEHYQKLLGKNPNHNHEHYQKLLGKNPNHNHEHYQKLLEKNPNYHKKLYQKNLEKNPNHNKEQYYCECCKNHFSLKHKARHERSQKHILNMAVLTDQDDSSKSENK